MGKSQEQTASNLCFRYFFFRRAFGFFVALSLICLVLELHHKGFNDTDEKVTMPQHVRDLQNSMKSVTPNAESTASHTLSTYQETLVQLEQQRRLHVLDKACQNLNLSRSLPNLSWQYTLHFIVDDEYKILFNFIPKVSCTTWKLVFNHVHKSHSGVGFRRLDTFSKQEIDFRLQNYRKAVFVREPVTRLLSAYLSKFQSSRVIVQQMWEKAYGEKIVNLYRKGRSFKRLNNTNGNEQMWLDEYGKEQMWLNVTLNEFIQYITDMDGYIAMSEFSDHFLQLYKVASPCAIQYDFIGHYENLTTEAPYMLKFLGVEHVARYPEVHNSQASQVLIDEYQKVPLNLIQKLYKYYQIDYELFGYSFGDTLKYIIEGSFPDDEVL